MVVATEHAHLKKMLSDTIPLLCKTSLGLFNLSFSVEAIVGITVNESDVLLVSFKETVLPDGSTVSLTWQKDDVDEVVTSQSACVYNDDAEVADDGRTFAKDSTKVLFDDKTSASNEVRETMEETYFINVKNPTVQSAYEESHDRKPTDEYSYQANCTSGCPTADGSEDVQHEYSAERADWGSVGRALQSGSSVGCMEEIDSSIVKLEKREIETDFDLTIPSKTGLKQKKDEETRYVGGGHAVAQRGPRRRGIGSNRRVVPRSGLPSVQRRLQVRKQPATTSGTANRHSSVSHRVQQWSNDAAISQGMPQMDPYEGMVDVLCRTAMQQSTVTAEKQYACRICHARLSSPNNLLAHIQGTHLALERYQCHLCLEKFRWYMQLHRHRKRCHSDMFPPSAL